MEPNDAAATTHESDEAEKRKRELLRIIDLSFAHHDSVGKRQKLIFNLLTALGLIGSGAAFVVGVLPSAAIFGEYTKYALAIIAAVPSATTIISGTFNFQGRQDRHYRKKTQLRSLKWRTEFELPAKPSLDNLAAISRQLAAINEAMAEELGQGTNPTSRPQGTSG